MDLRPLTRSLIRRTQGKTAAAGLLLAFLVSNLCLPGSGSAQEAPSQGYEGLKVASVDLVAQPSTNAEAFRPLVTQTAGSLYSAAEIQKTVAALQGTSKFDKVEVEVTVEAEGLRVAFLLEPVFSVGMILFPGANKVFAYTRLFQAVSYPTQEPYEAARADKGATSLKRWLAQQGYFAAQIQVETRVGPARKLVDILYHVTLGPHAKFGKIEISGPPPDEVEKLNGALHSLRARLHGADLKQGKPYEPARLQTATQFLQDYLGKENHLANRVRLRRPIYDPETKRVPPRWDVSLGPTVRVSVEGAKVSNRKLRSLIPVFEENAFDQDLVQEGERNLISYFQGQGYFNVKVTSRTSDEPSEVLLAYRVDRGSRFRLTNVKITGNRHVDEDNLWDQVVVHKARYLGHGTMSNDLVRRSVDNLTAYYRAAGYEEVLVKPQVAEKRHDVEVAFRIAEGDLTEVGTLNVEGNKTQTLAKLAPKGLNLKAGKPFSQALLDKDRSQIIANYLNMGYPNAALRWSLKKSGSAHHVDVTYLIDEGTQVTISTVADLGQVRTRQNFLEHNTRVKAGAPLSEDKILESESTLYNFGIFDWVNVAPRWPINNQKTEEVDVKVHEAKRNSITYGLGLEYTPVSGSLSSGIVALPGLPALGIPSSFKIIEKNVFSPLGSVEYSRLNLFGRAETASISTALSLLDQRASFSYLDPQFRGRNWSSLLNVSAERTTQNPLFTARLGTASFQMEKLLDAARTKRLQFRYSFQRTTLTDLLILNFIPTQDLNVRSSMASVTFIRDTRDKPLDAHRGWFQTVDFGVSPQVFGSSDSFARFFGQTAYYRELTPWMVWANNVRVGLVDSLAGSHVPFSERFFSGGADSLRGFPLNGAGPQQVATLCTKANVPSTCTANITAPVGGHQLFIINTEGRFPVPVYKGLGGAVFYDGGNVYSGIGFGHFFRDYSNTIGLGLRYQTPVGPIRIDVGHNLNPVPGLKATQLFITLGQSF